MNNKKKKYAKGIAITAAVAGMPVFMSVDAFAAETDLQLYNGTEVEDFIRENQIEGITYNASENKIIVTSDEEAQAKAQEIVAKFNVEVEKQKEAIANKESIIAENEAKKQQYDAAKAEYDVKKAEYDAKIKEREDYEAKRQANLEKQKEHLSDEGYATEVIDKQLVYDTEKNKNAVLNWRTSDGQSGTVDASTPDGTSKYFYLSQGATLTAEYTNLDESTVFAGTPIKKIVYEYTNISSARPDNKIQLEVYNNPGVSITMGAWNGEIVNGKPTSWQLDSVDKGTLLNMKIKFFDKEGTELTPDANTPAFLSLASLNRGRAPSDATDSVEGIYNIKNGTFVKINGSSVKTHGDSAYADAPNTYFKNDEATYPNGVKNWDGVPERAYWGAIVGKFTGAIEFDFGAPINTSRQAGWYTFNTDIKTIEEIPNVLPRLELEAPEAPAEPEYAPVPNVEEKNLAFDTIYIVSTTFVDEEGNSLRPPAKGIAPNEDIPHFDFDKTTTDEHGNQTHVYKAHKYNVTYEFVIEDGSEVPAEVNALVPESSTALHDEEVSANEPAEKSVKTEKGRYTFKSYDKEKVVIDSTDEKFTGTWVFEAFKEVPYEVITEDGTPVPPEVVEVMPPAEAKLLNGDEATAKPPTTTKVPTEKGVYIFKEYDKTTLIVEDGSKFVGKWEFKQYRNVPHVFKSTDGSELPEEVTKLLPPQLEKLIDGENAEPAAVENTEVITEKGKYIFKGWDKSSLVVDETSQFIGTWEFNKAYDVSYKFVSEDGKELPKSVLELLPTNENKLYSGDTVDAEKPSKTEVFVEGGKYVFVSYDKDSVKIEDKSELFTGMWKFMPELTTQYEGPNGSLLPPVKGYEFSEKKEFPGYRYVRTKVDGTVTTYVYEKIEEPKKASTPQTGVEAGLAGPIAGLFGSVALLFKRKRD